MADLTGLLVLVIEDDPDLNNLVVSELEMWGASTLTAHTLAEARATCEEHKPDAIVSDVRLPDGSAIDFLKDFTGQNDRPIIVLISGYEIAASDGSDLDIDVDATFPKPTNWDDVMVTLGELAHQRKKAV